MSGDPVRALKVGDKVRCVDPHNDWLQMGKVYIVKEVFGDLVGLNVAPGIIWSPTRFTNAAQEGGGDGD